jgi:hypothetical protein
VEEKGTEEEDFIIMTPKTTPQHVQNCPADLINTIITLIRETLAATGCTGLFILASKTVLTCVAVAGDSTPCKIADYLGDKRMDFTQSRSKSPAKSKISFQQSAISYQSLLPQAEGRKLKAESYLKKIKFIQVTQNFFTDEYFDCTASLSLFVT